MDIKKEGINVALGLGLVVILMVVIRVLGLTKWWIIALLIAVQFLLQIFRKKFNFKALLKGAVTVVILVHVIMWLDVYGIIGFLLMILGISAYILIKRRHKFLQAKHYIESMIWGKPLKDFKAAGEKPPKLKVRL